MGQLQNYPAATALTDDDLLVILNDPASGGRAVQNITAADARGYLGGAKRTTFSNANYTMDPADRYVAQVGTMSALRTVTLALSSAVPAGTEVVIADESGTVTGSFAVAVAPAGSDTIDGINSVAIRTHRPYGQLRLTADGTSKWSVDRDTLRATTDLLSATPTENVWVVRDTSGTPIAKLYNSNALAQFTLGGNISGFDAQNRVQGQSAGYYLDRYDGTQEWLVYRTGAGVSGLYVRDVVNARMHVTYWPGTTNANAQTEFASDVRVLGPLYIGGTTISITSGSGTPEGVVPAEIGALYLRTNGVAGTTLYTKVSGSWNTGWAPIAPTVRTAFSNADVTATTADRVLAQTGTLSAARVITLPAANSVPGGTILQAVDESGTATGANTLSWARAGSDTINGGAGNVVAVNAAYGNGKVMSDGTSKWTVV